MWHVFDKGGGHVLESLDLTTTRFVQAGLLRRQSHLGRAVVHYVSFGNGVTAELLPPKTRLRIKRFARNVMSLKSSYYGGIPTEDTA